MHRSFRTLLDNPYRVCCSLRDTFGFRPVLSRAAFRCFLLRTYPTFLRFWTLGLIRPFLPEPSSEHSLGVLWPLLTSRILRHPSRNVLSLRRRDLDARPPQVLTKSFTACSRHIYTRTIRAVWNLIHSWGLVHVLTPAMWFLFIDSRFCLLLPSDPSSRMTPLD